MDHPGYEAFTWPQFAWLLTLFVGVPVLGWVLGLGLAAHARRRSSGRRAPVGRMWAAGLLTWLLAIAGSVGWLSWTASDGDGRAQGPSLMPPGEYPTWQIVACGVTLALVCVLGGCVARAGWPGDLAAVVGTTAGFTTAFAFVATADSTGQSGVGLLMGGVGLTVASMLVMGVKRAVQEWRRRGTGARQGM